MQKSIDLGLIQDQCFLIWKRHVFSETDKHDKNTLFSCRNCLITITSVETFIKHEEICLNNERCSVKFAEVKTIENKKNF